MIANGLTYTKVAQIVQCVLCYFLVDFYLWELLYPIVLQSVFRTDSVIWFERQQFIDKINSLSWYWLPLLLVRSKPSLFHILYYLIVIRTIEWWITTKENV